METDLKYELLPNDNKSQQISFKVIIIGDSGVGKSSLTVQAIKNQFIEYYTATVGFEFYTFNIKVEDTPIKLQIWDTCGQEVYKSLVNNFYRNASLAILVYSIDNEKSFVNVDSWLKELKTQSHPDVKVFLVGNKSDLNDARACSKEMGQQFASENAVDFFCESSAKSGENSKNIFIQAAKTLYKEYRRYNPVIPVKGDEMANAMTFDKKIVNPKLSVGKTQDKAEVKCCK